MTQLIFLNRFFYPDHSATSQILSDLAFSLAKRGHRVSIITSRQRYDAPDANLAERETVCGVEIYRIMATRFGRRWVPGRGFDYLSFYISAAWTLLQLAHQGDVVVAETDPPMLCILVDFLMPLRRFKAINWLQDLYPEVAAELGVAGLGGIIGRSLIRLRNRSLHRSELNVVIGEDMARRLYAMGLPPEKVTVIHNWTDDATIMPITEVANPLRREWGLEGKFVIAYSGNLGRAHDFETLLGAAEHLKYRTDIIFLFIGGGHGIPVIEEEVHRRKLTNVLVKPYQLRDLLSHSLGVGDVHWLSLKAGLDGLILPSKFYGIAAAGRPIIVIGSPDGEVSRLVVEWDCGIHIGLGKSEDLTRTIIALEADRAHLQKMGRNARRLLEERFTKALALERWHQVLQVVGSGSQ